MSAINRRALPCARKGSHAGLCPPGSRRAGRYSRGIARYAYGAVTPRARKAKEPSREKSPDPAPRGSLHSSPDPPRHNSYTGTSTQARPQIGAPTYISPPRPSPCREGSRGGS
eukprot:7340506-Prymnesium_polylepis.1